MKTTTIIFICIFSLFSLGNIQKASAFTPSPTRGFLSRSSSNGMLALDPFTFKSLGQQSSTTYLKATSEDGDFFSLEESDQAVVGVVGTLAALVVFYSEFTLKTTGCGVPAGPFGLFGLVEGLSYLGVVGLAALSVVTKVKTGTGLPAGPGGLLGAAEGLSFLAILVGVVVLALQVMSYGYIPNAVPMEGAMCS